MINADRVHGANIDLHSNHNSSVMKKQPLTSTSISDLFTPALTERFKVDMDIALKTLNLANIKEVLEKYQIAHFQDSIDFLEAIEPILTSWKKEGQRSEVVGSVTTSESRCIACEIGKNVTIYEFVYWHRKAPFPMNRVQYKRDFGILMDIKNGILYEIRVCNAFLDKYEMKALNEI